MLFREEDTFLIILSIFTLIWYTLSYRYIGITPDKLNSDNDNLQNKQKVACESFLFFKSQNMRFFTVL